MVGSTGSARHIGRRQTPQEAVACDETLASHASKAAKLFLCNEVQRCIKVQADEAVAVLAVTFIRLGDCIHYGPPVGLQCDAANVGQTSCGDTFSERRQVCCRNWGSTSIKLESAHHPRVSFQLAREHQWDHEKQP